jgi:hypothetical protein
MHQNSNKFVQVVPQIMILLGTTRVTNADCLGQLNCELTDGDDVAETAKGKGDFHGDLIDA